MVMTRKDFKAIAEIIDKATDTGDNPTIESHRLIGGLSNYFHTTNSRFHADKFFDAATKRQEGWKVSKRKQREFTLTWSEKYYPGLSPEKHGDNNSWMRDVLSGLKDTGVIFVPNLGKTFNKQGEEVNG